MRGSIPFPSFHVAAAMLKTDALRMVRDQFLVGITAYLLFVFLLMRFAIPWLTEQVADQWDFDLVPYHRLLVSYLVVHLAPLVPGIVGGFLLLECREEGTAKALSVAPTPLASYVVVTCMVMTFAAWILAVAAGAMIGIGLPPWPALLTISMAAAPFGPAFALLIAAVANNKVEAFAYMKMFGLGPLLATVAYFVPEPLQWLAAIYPPYCAGKAYWLAGDGVDIWPMWIVLGVIGSSLWLAILQSCYLRAART